MPEPIDCVCDPATCHAGCKYCKDRSDLYDPCPAQEADRG